MCQQHRMEVPEKLRENLPALQQASREKRKVRRILCISTQLIEAGVDLSFQCVIRILAGIDNLAQAAGRCNRSNEYGEAGRVYLVNLKGENLSMLREIKNAQDSTRRVAENWKEERGSLIEEQATRAFYRYLFEETESEIRYPVRDWGETVYLADLLSNSNGSAENEENRSYYLHQPFKTIGREFSVFDQNTVDVAVPYEEGKLCIEELRQMDRKGFDWEKFDAVIHKIKGYTVSIYEWQRRKLDQEGMLESILDGRILALNGKAYDDQFGLFMPGQQPVENFVL